MALNTILQEGSFTSDIRNALNSNFSGIVSGNIPTLTLYTQTILSGSADAIPAGAPGVYVVTTAGVDAMTLAAPPVAENGNEIIVSSATANAHTLTSTGNLLTGNSGKTGVLTFAAVAGASVTLMAYNGKWIVTSSNAITFTS